MSLALGITPPIQDLKDLSGHLKAANIKHALGGSGLLHFLGMLIAVEDWDLTVDIDQRILKNALAGYALKISGASGPYKSRYICRLPLESCRIEIIGGFAIETPAGIEHIRTVVVGEYQGIPLGSPYEWLKAYRAMGRPDDTEKANWLSGYLTVKESQ